MIAPWLALANRKVICILQVVTVVVVVLDFHSILAALSKKSNTADNSQYHPSAESVIHTKHGETDGNLTPDQENKGLIARPWAAKYWMARPAVSSSPLIHPPGTS